MSKEEMAESKFWSLVTLQDITYTEVTESENGEYLINFSGAITVNISEEE